MALDALGSAAAGAGAQAAAAGRNHKQEQQGAAPPQQQGNSHGASQPQVKVQAQGEGLQAQQGRQGPEQPRSPLLTPSLSRALALSQHLTAQLYAKPQHTSAVSVSAAHLLRRALQQTQPAGAGPSAGGLQAGSTGHTPTPGGATPYGQWGGGASGASTPHPGHKDSGTSMQAFNHALTQGSAGSHGVGPNGSLAQLGGPAELLHARLLALCEWRDTRARAGGLSILLPRRWLMLGRPDKRVQL